jgi:hypothetical protein
MKKKRNLTEIIKNSCNRSYTTVTANKRKERRRLLMRMMKRI